jgi:hypothetical protein
MLTHHFGARRASLALCVLLISCGGGNGNEAPIPQVKLSYFTAEVRASGMNPAAYLGTWTSECGEIIPSQGIKSARNHFYPTQATATTVSGTFDQWQYTDSDCKQPRMILDLPTVEGTVTFKLVETVQLEDTHSPIGINYLGTADRVEATIKPSDQPNPQTRYLALQGENEMRVETKLPLANMGLTYSRTKR